MKKEVKISQKKVERVKRALAEIHALKKELGEEVGQEEREVEVKVSPEKVKRVKEALAEIHALKKELEENSDIGNLDLLLFMASMEGKLSDKLSNIDNKLSWLSGWLIGASAVIIGLLIAIAVAIF